MASGCVCVYMCECDQTVVHIKLLDQCYMLQWIEGNRCMRYVVRKKMRRMTFFLKALIYYYKKWDRDGIREWGKEKNFKLENEKTGTRMKLRGETKYEILKLTGNWFSSQYIISCEFRWLIFENFLSFLCFFFISLLTVPLISFSICGLAKRQHPVNRPWMWI